MTSFQHGSGGETASGPATLLAPELTTLPDAGPESATLREVLAFGLDPAAAFGAAFVLKKTVSNEKVNATLNRWAGRPEGSLANKASPAPPTAPSSPAASAASSPSQVAMANSGAASANTGAATANTGGPQHAGASENLGGAAQGSPATQTPESSLHNTAPSPADADTRAFATDSAGSTTAPDGAAGQHGDRAGSGFDDRHARQPGGGPEHPGGGGGNLDPARNVGGDPAMQRPSVDAPDAVRTTSSPAVEHAAGTPASSATSTPHGPIVGTGPDASDAARRAPAGAPNAAAGHVDDAARRAQAGRPAGAVDGPEAEKARAAARQAPHAGAGAASESHAVPRAAGGAPEAPRAAPRSGADLARETRDAIRQGFARDGAKGAVKEATREAAKKGALLGSRTAAATLLRLGALSMPGVGTALTVLVWALDTEGRKEFAKMWGTLFSDSIAAPDVNAPPEPPRTQFLPLTHDGGRDPLIDQMDKAMVNTMAKSFDFPADDVWPTVNAPIETTTNLSATIHAFNELGSLLSDAISTIQNSYQAGASEPYIGQVWEKTKPGIDTLRDVQETVLPAMGRLLVDGATNANDAYKGFRSVNLKNRQAINNSSNGFLGWLFPGIHAEDMSDSTREMTAAVESMQRIADQMAAAADKVSVAPNRLTGESPVGSKGEKEAPVEPNPGLVTSPLVNPGPSTAPPAGLATKPEDNPAKDLASLLKGAGIPQIPNPASMIPQTPNLGGMMPDLGSMVPPGAGLNKDPLAGNKTGLTEEDIAKKLEELKNAKDKDPLGKKEGPDNPIAPLSPVANPAPVTQPAQGPQQQGTPAAEHPPAASNTADIGGKKIQFDNPKSAAMAQKLVDGHGATSLYTAASEAGLQVPPHGQDIGEPIPIGGIEKGDVVLGANDRGVFIGEVDGQPMVVTETGEVKPLGDVAKFGSPNTGIFRLADTGSPMPNLADPTAGQVPAAPAVPTAPPVSPLTTAQTDPGVIPGQQTGSTGLNPGIIPPQP